MAEPRRIVLADPLARPGAPTRLAVAGQGAPGAPGDVKMYEWDGSVSHAVLRTEHARDEQRHGQEEEDNARGRVLLEGAWPVNRGARIRARGQDGTTTALCQLDPSPVRYPRPTVVHHRVLCRRLAQRISCFPWPMLTP